MKRLLETLPALAVAGLLGACSSTPPLQFYTLGPLAAPPASAAQASTSASLVVGPVSVPATIDRLLIVRLAGSRAEVAEHHRWAAPLKTEIARRIAADLARRSPYTRSVAWPLASIADPTLSVPIDVLRFEADGGAAMRAILDTEPVDIVVIDVMMPGEDGLTLARSLSGRRDLGIVMVSALGSETDRIIGL